MEGTKYLLVCKKNYRIARWDGSSSNSVLANAVRSADENSFFTVEATEVDGATYYYIRSAKDATQFVYAKSTADDDSNVGVKAVSDDASRDDACLWSIVYNTSTYGYNIKPKGGSNGWNCRGGSPNQSEIGQWSSNNTDDNTWLILAQTTPEALSAKVSEYESSLLKQAVGYPSATASVRTTFTSDVANAKSATSETANQLNAVLEVDKIPYLAVTDVQMPEDGKSYTFTVVNFSGTTKRYLNYAGETTGYQMVTTTDADNSKYPQTATLICHKLSDGSYVFLNNEGKYLIIPVSDSGASPQGKGYSSTYVQTISNNEREVAKLTLTKMTKDTYVKAENPKCFGYLYLKGYRKENGSNAANATLIVKDETGAFDKSEAPYFNSSYTSALLIEEVDYANKVSFSPTGNTFTDVSHIATFSAPFATVIPDGVEAYYVKRDGERAMVTKIEAEAIPANTGVLLTSESGASVYMAPAATETQATIDSNDLGNSAGAAKTLAAGAGYILGNGSKGVAFYKAAAGTLPMNKAYLLPSDSDASASSIQMVFGGTVEGIADDIASPDSSNAPMYDLTGRRVLKPAKGGVYIQNGQKRIMK